MHPSQGFSILILNFKWDIIMADHSYAVFLFLDSIHVLYLRPVLQDFVGSVCFIYRTSIFIDIELGKVKRIS